MKQGVYIIHFEDDPEVYKIGESGDIDHRISNIKSVKGKSSKAIIDHIIEISPDRRRALEDLLHTTFRHRLVDSGRSQEWFRLTSEDLDDIRRKTPFYEKQLQWCSDFVEIYLSCSSPDRSESEVLDCIHEKLQNVDLSYILHELEEEERRKAAAERHIAHVPSRGVIALPYLRILDLYCGGGGAAWGYHKALQRMGIAHQITGIDINPQPRYPFRFIQSDAVQYLSLHGCEYDFIHASPECKGYSQLTLKKYRGNHAKQIGLVHDLLIKTGRPYVIENVKAARKELNSPLMLCGSMFGLKVWRHRYFELGGFDILLTPPCNHSFRPIPVNSSSAAKTANTAECREGLQIDWLRRDEMRQAVPPAYTDFIMSRYAYPLFAP